MKNNENKTLEQLQAELEQAQKAYDLMKKEVAQKEAEEVARKKTELAEKKDKRRKEIEEVGRHYHTLIKQFIKDYGSYEYSGKDEDDDIFSFIFGEKPWRFFF